MAAGTSEKIFLGLELTMNAEGVVSGARVANRAFDKTRNTARRTGDQIDKEAKRIANGLKAAAAAAAVGIAGIGAGNLIKSQVLDPMINQAKSFEVEFNALKFVTGATGDELARLRDTVIQVGLATQFSPQEATLGLRMLKAAGLDTETALSSLTASLDLASASMGTLGLGEAAQATAALINKFTHEGLNARQMLDQLAEVTRRTNFQFADLPQFLSSIRSAATVMKLASAEALVLGGILKSSGLSAGDAGQAINGMAQRLGNLQVALRRVESNGGKVNKRSRVMFEGLKKLGVQVFDTAGKFRPMRDVLGEFSDAIQALPNDQERMIVATAVMGQSGKNLTTAISNMATATKTGGQAFKDLINDVELAEGPLREAAAAFEDTLAGLEVFLQGTKDTILIILGETLFPMLKFLGGLLRTVSGAFLNLVQANPALAKAIAFMTGFLVILLITGGSVLTLLAGLQFAALTMGPAFLAAGGAVGFFTASLATLKTVVSFAFPVIRLLALGFGALVVAFALGTKIIDADIGGLTSGIKSAFKTVSLVMDGFFTFFSGGLIKGTKAVNLAVELQRRGLLGFVLTLLQWKERIVAFFEGIMVGVDAAFGTIQSILSPFIKAIVAVGKAFGGLFSSVEASNIESELAGWRRFGEVLSFFAVIAIFRVTFSLALMARRMVFAAARLASLTAIWIIQAIAVNAVVIGYVLLGAALFFVGLLIGTLIIKFLEWIGVVEEGTSQSLGFFNDFWNDVAFLFNEAINLVTDWGANFFGGMLEGLKSSWVAVKDWFGEKMQFLRDMMPGSDAKIGPLSDLTASGGSLVTTLQQGMELKFPGLIDQFSTGLGTLLGDATAPANINGVTPGTAPAAPLANVVPIRPATAPTAATGTAEKTNGGAPSRTINIAKMELVATNATPEEAQRLAKMVMDNIQEMGETETEASFA